MIAKAQANENVGGEKNRDKKTLKKDHDVIKVLKTRNPGPRGLS